MTDRTIRAALAAALREFVLARAAQTPRLITVEEDAARFRAILARRSLAVLPVEPTRAMLDAARDWSLVKYHQGVGDDAASGCYRAMLAAASEDRAPQSTAPLFGSWPGDESDADVERFLKEIS